MVGTPFVELEGVYVCEKGSSEVTEMSKSDTKVDTALCREALSQVEAIFSPGTVTERQCWRMLIEAGRKDFGRAERGSDCGGSRL